MLPEVFALYKKQYPRVGVSIRRSEHSKILDAVNFNAVDFGVVQTSSPMVPALTREQVTRHLDEAGNTMYRDINAAGWGSFLDKTPGNIRVIQHRALTELARQTERVEQ